MEKGMNVIMAPIHEKVTLLCHNEKCTVQWWCPWILLSHRLAFYEAPQRSFSTLVLTTQHEKLDHPTTTTRSRVTFVSTGKRAGKPKWVSRNLSSYWLRGENFIRHYSCLTFQQSLFLVAKEAWLKLSKVGNWGKLAKRFSSLVDFQNFLWSVFSQVSSVNKWNFGVGWG